MITLKDFSLVIIKNDLLLESIKDYFYENLLHDFEVEHIFVCDLDEIDQTLSEIKTKYSAVIQEGIFFFDHMDNNFLKSVIENLDDHALIGHILDRKERYYHLHQQQFILDIDKWKQIGKPSFNLRSGEVVNIKRSSENFHDDYTPVWIKKDQGTKSYDKLKFGGRVISELLKSNFKVRPFNEKERHVKKFVYYGISEQISHLLSYEKVNPYSFYYPITTRRTDKVFDKTAHRYISVANAVESLNKIKDVYKDIKTIDFYDVSITALIFTEYFIKNFNGDYKNFVKDFDNMGAKDWTTLDLSDDNYDAIDNYEESVEKINDVLQHIRNNVKVNYYYGDITRSSIIESLEESTIIYVSNCFNYQYNFIRSNEWEFWRNKAGQNQYLKQFLR